MCGIAGIYAPGGATGDPALHLLMRRRGPDDAGTWDDPQGRIHLAHRRLSIIDTSSAGHQPMLSRDGRVAMVYNGEIYNFMELRRSLEAAGERFEGHSDSEVLLALFSREGPECLKRLNGIFAVAFWEIDSGTLTLARDPIGIKPLYVARRAGGVAFASEMKALLRTGLVEPRLDPEAVLRHIGFLWSPGSRTLVEGIAKVEPGHVLQFRNGVPEKEWRYRDIAYAPVPERELPVDAAAAQVAAAVETAVQRQMVSDVPLGAFLSGGLDSSAIAAFAQKHVAAGSKLQCFSIRLLGEAIGDEGFADDLPYARRVADVLGVDLHVVEVGSDILDRVAEMVYFLDEPTPDPAALNALSISELARSHGIKVLLSGAGGDDIFTGYRRHFALLQEKWWAWMPQGGRALLSAAAGRLPAGHPALRRVAKAFQYAGQDASTRLASYFLWLEPERALRLLSPGFRGRLSSDAMHAPMLASLARLGDGVEPLNRMLYLEGKHFLADHNLNYTDKMGMAAGVEVRVPLLDLDLVDLASRLPTAYKQHGRVGKWIFKRAMEPYLPRDVIYRPKTGFGAPLRKWLHGPLAGLVDDTLSERSVRARGILDAGEVRKLLADDRAGRLDASYPIFALVCLELWCRQHIDGAYPVDGGMEMERKIA